jgi:hypothetical protein
MYVRIIWKKEWKGMTAALRRRQKGLFILNLPWFCATSNKPHPNATNAIQYREQIDESCLPYQQITISNLNCHANLNLQDCVESVPGHVESAKPSCCRLLCSVFKGYTSISLILIHSCCFISVLTNTASGKSGKRSPDPLQLPRFSHL